MNKLLQPRAESDPRVFKYETTEHVQLLLFACRNSHNSAALGLVGLDRLREADRCWERSIVQSGKRTKRIVVSSVSSSPSARRTAWVQGNGYTSKIEMATIATRIKPFHLRCISSCSRPLSKPWEQWGAYSETSPQPEQPVRHKEYRKGGGHPLTARRSQKEAAKCAKWSGGEREGERGRERETEIN